MNDVTKPDPETLIIRRRLKAPQALAFAAWTTPEHIARWMEPEPGMKIPSAFVDLRVGGRFRIQMLSPEGEYFTAAGVYEEVEVPSRVVYTWDWEVDGSGLEFGELEGNPSLITIDFIPQGDETDFLLTHTRFATIESRDNHARGWGRAVDTLAEHLAAGALAVV